jgi:murein DD-endopeptidase MepM/ murein hydrolase activator NlpD
MGDAYVLRAQRVIIQQWKKDVAWAKAGSITIALGGDIAKEIGLIAAVAPQAVVPQSSAPATINVSVPKAPPAPPSNSTKQAPGAQQCPNALFVIPSNGTLGTTYRQPGGGEAGFSDVHTGIDILGTTDDDVYAAYDGVVSYLSYPRGSIWHADLGVETYYTHMSVITVKPGQKVQRGEVIGKKGAVNTGGIVLLHFSVKKRSIDERYLANTFDPSPYLKANVNYTTGARQFLRPVMGWCN